MIQENRSFDDLFATFPGADGTTTGMWKEPDGHLEKVRLHPANLVEPCDFGHGYKTFLTDYDGGAMDGFGNEGSGGCNRPAQTLVYQYVDPKQIAPYWDLARQYVLADHLFQTQGSGSYTAHQDLIRGDTVIDEKQTESLVDFPSSLPWGCDAPEGVVTSLLDWTGTALEYHYDGGPFPCTRDFPASGRYYQTLRDLLDAKSISWKYYSPAVVGNVGAYWNAFDTVAPVRYGPEWKTNVTHTEKAIFGDIARQELPAVSWVIPDERDSDHPGSDGYGPSWIASVVNSIGESPYWDSTAIVILWDDWGGFYDHVRPRFFDHWGGLGFRVAMIVVSPYSREATPGRPGYIEHTQYEFGSILKFIENNWNLGRLGTTDVRAESIVDCFDFTQAPRPFKPIRAEYSRAYFERQPPSYKPVDTE
jgi:phospholipase C